MSDHDSFVDLADLLCVSGKDMHYMFEVLDSMIFLQRLLGEEDAKKVQWIPATLTFRDNTDLAESGINIVTQGMPGLPAWDGLEEDAPEVHKYSMLNAVGTQAYFVYDPFFSLTMESNKIPVTGQTVLLFADDIMEQEFTPYVTEIDNITGTYGAKGASMTMSLNQVGPGISYVMLTPKPDFPNGITSDAERKKIKYRNKVESVKLMQQFCDDGLLEPMTEMPLQFIQRKLQTTNLD